MLTCYIDTSAFLRWLLQSPGFYEGFASLDGWVSSVLLKVEVKRSLDRLYKNKDISMDEKETFLDYFLELEPFFTWIDIDEEVLSKASETFAYSVGSLDAIHLASAYLFKQNYVVGKYYLLTHDKELAKVAESLGISYKGV